MSVKYSESSFNHRPEPSLYGHNDAYRIFGHADKTKQLRCADRFVEFPAARKIQIYRFCGASLNKAHADKTGCGV